MHYRGATFVASYDFDGQPPEIHPNKGRMLKDDPPGFDPSTHRLVRDPVTEETTDAVAYREVELTPPESYERALAACHAARRAAYGSWEEQLDLQFHGTWKAHVAAVKAAHPKPTPP